MSFNTGTAYVTFCCKSIAPSPSILSVDVSIWAKKMKALAGAEVTLMLNKSTIKKKIVMGRNSVIR